MHIALSVTVVIDVAEGSVAPVPLLPVGPTSIGSPLASAPENAPIAMMRQLVAMLKV
jgi:hypothetical protein